MTDFEAPESTSEQAAAWVFFSTLVVGTFLANAWPSAAASADSAARLEELEAGWQTQLADPQVAAVAGSLSLLVLMLFGVGSVKAFLALKADAAGHARAAFADCEQLRLGPRRLPYFELVSLFLLALILVGGVAANLASRLDSQLPLLLNWVCAGVFAWPLLRGKSAAEIRLALGWHRGEGFFKEIAAGLAAYLTAWPLLAVGLVFTAGLSRLIAERPTHPLLDWIEDPSPGALVVAALLAVVWAPLCEESVFRGAFYAYLRGRLGKLGAGLAVGLAFAAIHPQGLAGIPFLASLALALALTREWRGSIIASVTMHALHNGLAVLGLVLILR